MKIFSKVQFKTILSVVIIHILVIGCSIANWQPKARDENMYRVELGSEELSPGEEVGPPERRAPGDLPAPKPAPKPAPNPAPKPAPNPEQESVYNPDQSGPIGGGGSNLNPNVPGGSKDQAQAYGKPDNHSPGGGANVKVKQYAERSLMPYLKSRWKQPPDSLLKGKRPAVEISLTILPTGKVKKATVTRASNVAAMDDSVKRLLNGLDILPRPPDGELTIKITLETE